MNPISHVSRFVFGTYDDKAQIEINKAIDRITQLSGAGTQPETMRAIDHSIAAEIGVLSRNCSDQLIATLKQQDPPLLGEAIKAGLNEVTKTLLELIPSTIDAPDRFGKTPLILAVERENIEMVKTLASAGASPHATDARGCTALIWAAMTGIVDLVKSLFGAGAIQSVDVQDKMGNTALTAAVSRGYFDIAKVLITEGQANVLLANRDGETALSLAVQDDDEELVDLLCTHGANVNARDEDGRTAVMAAYDASNKRMVEHLISEVGADITLADNEGRTLLHLAARQGDDEGVRSLCESGADVNAQDVNGFSPLVHAIQSGNPDAVEVLLSTAADVNARDNEGRTVMFHLSDNQSSYGWHSPAFKATFDRLFEAGARLEAMDEKVREKLYSQWDFDQAQRARLGLPVTGFASNSRG